MIIDKQILVMIRKNKFMLNIHITCFIRKTNSDYCKIINLDVKKQQTVKNLTILYWS